MIALMVLAVGWSFAEANHVAVQQRDVTVLFTSDVHCGVDQGLGYVGLEAIRDTLQREGGDVLLVDNGDALQGTSKNAHRRRADEFSHRSENPFGIFSRLCRPTWFNQRLKQVAFALQKP